RQNAYQAARVRQLYDQAVNAFERTDYKKSEEHARRVLAIEPTHQDAAKLVERAKTARRFKEELYTIENGIEEMKRLMEGVYEAAIPYQAIFAFPADDEWQQVQRRAVQLQDAFERKGTPESPEEARIKGTLNSRRVTINFPG